MSDEKFFQILHASDDAPKQAFKPFSDRFGIALAVLLNRFGGEVQITEEEIAAVSFKCRIVECPDYALGIHTVKIEKLS